MRKPVLIPGLREVTALTALLVFAFLLCGEPVGGQVLGTISGTVSDSAGTPLLGAEVGVDGSQIRTFTDERGMFHLGGVPYGARALNARRLGFSPAQVNVEVAQGSDAMANIRLKPLAATLPAVVIRPSRMSYTGRLAGYYERLERRSSGYFITRDGPAAPARARCNRGTRKGWGYWNQAARADVLAARLDRRHTDAIRRGRP
jgi:hypothetical protein